MTSVSKPFWAAKDNRDTLEVILEKPTKIDQIVIREKPATKGLGDGFSKQHEFYIESFKLQTRENGQWTPLYTGTQIGHAKRIDLPKAVTCDGLRLVITKANKSPRIAHFAAALRSTAGKRSMANL